MADLQLILKYQPRALAPLHSIFYALKWLCIIIIPSLWLLSLVALLTVPALSTWLYSGLTGLLLGLGVGYACLIALVALLTLPISDSRMKLSKDGVVLPWLTARASATRVNHIWSEFTSATILPALDRHSEKLVLGLDSGKSVTLDLSGFETAEQEQLLLGLELWGKSLVRSSDLIDYQMMIQNESKGIEHVSYTRMWEDELDRRFRSTSFLPLDPGHKLRNGQFTVVRQLAFGGLSAIYLAQKSENELFILKEAVVPGDSNPERRRLAEKCLAREATMLTRVSHPNITRVIDYFVEEGRHYLILEHINGQDLRQFVRQYGPQDPAKVMDWASQIAEALSCLHANDPPIIHRDLTPDNIVLRNDGSVMVIDFGAANEFVGNATGTLIGKQAYMAPEQLRGKATWQSDIYSFGATLFFLLTSRDPLPLASNRPATVLPEISHEIDDLVAILTQPDAALRPASNLEINRRLLEIAESEDERKTRTHAHSGEARQANIDCAGKPEESAGAFL